MKKFKNFYFEKNHIIFNKIKDNINILKFVALFGMITIFSLFERLYENNFFICQYPFF